MNNLARLRGKHGYTQQELANKLGVGKAGVSFWETHKITPNKALECAKVLNENMFYILGKDVLRALPKTEEDKEALLKVISEL